MYFSGKIRKNVAPGYSRFRTFIIICAVARDFDFSEWNRKNRQNRAWQTKRWRHVARKSVKKVASINDETTGILRCVFMVKSEIQSFEIVNNGNARRCYFLQFMRRRRLSGGPAKHFPSLVGIKIYSNKFRIPIDGRVIGRGSV